MMHWIILADTTLYRIYSYQQKTKLLSLLMENYHPKSKAKASDLVTDSLGHYKTRTEARGAYASHTDPREEEIERFLKTLAEEIEKGRVNNQYQKFTLIALPKVTGVVAKHLSENTKRLMSKNIQKDYIHLAEHEFVKILQECM